MFPYASQTLLFILYAFFFVPVGLITARFRGVRMSQHGDQPRVLVIPQLTRIGDILCTTPAIHAIRASYPKAFIAVLTTEKVRGVLEHNPDIDRLIIFHANAARSVAREIANFRFTHALGFSGTWLSTIFMAIAGIPKRIKLVRTPRPFAEFVTDFLNTHRMRYRDHTSAPRHYSSMLRPLGIHGPCGREVATITVTARERVKAFLRENGVGRGETLVGISITAGNTIKEWGDEHFVAVAAELSRRFDARIVWIGGPADKDRIAAAVKLSSGAIRSVAAVGWPLADLPALLKELDLYIAVDTGPIYMAHAVGTPLVDITGPVDPWEQPPHDSSSVCVMPPAPFYPSSFVFMGRGGPERHAESLERITVTMVVHAAVTLLERSRKDHRAQ